MIANMFGTWPAVTPFTLLYEGIFDLVECSANFVAQMSILKEVYTRRRLP